MESALEGDGSEVGVPQGALLVEFGEAMLGGGEGRRKLARNALYAAMGPAALVDAAATVASFNAVVKLADGSGIPLEEFKAQGTVELRAELSLEKLNRDTR
jgi:hypothetical protein